MVLTISRGVCFPTRAVTKQEHIRQEVIALIRELGVGEAIPSERRLSTDLGVSRLTLRAALDELVREGYLVRRHGSGTFVGQPKIAQQLTLTSFSEDMRRRGLVPDSRTLRPAIASSPSSPGGGGHACLRRRSSAPTGHDGARRSLLLRRPRSPTRSAGSRGSRGARLHRGAAHVLRKRSRLLPRNDAGHRGRVA